MMRHQVISSYCRDYFPRIKCTNDIDTSHFVFLSIFGLPQKSLMLETACSALGYIFQGRIRRDEHVLQYGVGLYNQAIRLLAHAISQKSDYASTEDIVYTCVIFQQVQVRSVEVYVKYSYTDSQFFRFIILPIVLGNGLRT